MKRRPILISGAPRSGTTFVGELMGCTRSVGVIFEPFHPDAGVCGRAALLPEAAEGLRVEFPFVTAEQPQAAALQRMLTAVVTGRAAYLRPEYGGRHGWMTTLARQVLTSRLAMHNRFTTRWPFHTRFVIKDPHLCLAAPYIHTRMGWPCLVTIRHPAATAESWRRLGWCPDLRQFWEQPLLWERHLQTLPRPEQDWLSALERAAYAWLYINQALRDFQRLHPDMAFIRLEEIAANPVESFRILYKRFDLPFDSGVERTICAHTASGGDQTGTRRQPHRLKRDSRSVLAGWKQRMSQAEQKAVRTIVGETGQALYPDETW